MSRLRQRWDEFWYREASPFNLGLFRILFAYCLWREVSTTLSRSRFAIEGGYHIPYLDFLPLVSQQTYVVLHQVQYPLIALLGLGLCTRWAGSALLLLQGYVFFSDQMNFRNHPYFFLLVLLALVLSPARDALSVRAWVRGRRAGRSVADSLAGDERPLTFQRLIQVQLCLVYFYAGLHKLNPAFLGGEVIAGSMGRELLEEDSSALLAQVLSQETIEALLSPFVMAAMAWGTAVVELFLPFGLWFRRTRALALVLGAGMHLFIAMSMHIVTFSLACIATYVLFVAPRAIYQVLVRPQPALATSSATGIEQAAPAD
jgi:hypothetical protein